MHLLHMQVKYKSKVDMPIDISMFFTASDGDAGLGLKAAFAYFDGEEIDPAQLTPGAFTVFCVIRPYIDESMRDFQESVESGRAGAEKRWGDR